MNKYKNKKAFTLIEVIIVMVIIGILMGVLVPGIKGYMKLAKEVKIKADLHTVHKAVESAILAYNNELPGFINENRQRTGGTLSFTNNLAIVDGDYSLNIEDNTDLILKIGEFMPEKTKIALENEFKDKYFFPGAEGKLTSDEVDFIHWNSGDFEVDEDIFIDLYVGHDEEGAILLNLYEEKMFLGEFNSDEDPNTYGICLIYEHNSKNNFLGTVITNEGFVLVNGREFYKIP